MLISVRYCPGATAAPKSPLNEHRVFTAYWKDVLSCAWAGLDTVTASIARKTMIESERTVRMTSSQVRMAITRAGRNARAYALQLYTRKGSHGRAENPFA